MRPQIGARHNDRYTTPQLTPTWWESNPRLQANWQRRLDSNQHLTLPGRSFLALRAPALVGVSFISSVMAGF
jgi:hypothetical protein